jgi:phosphodiesterase/alkaline phosphatase D-like protein
LKLDCFLGMTWALMVTALAQPSSSPLIMTEMLGRPTDTSVTVNALADRNLEVYFEYGLSSTLYTDRTPAAVFAAGTPIEMVLNGLQPDKQYFYRMRHREVGAAEFTARTERTFHTQRARGSRFSFAVQADPHMDENSDAGTYRLTLQNELAAAPDFLKEYKRVGDVVDKVHLLPPPLARS